METLTQAAPAKKPWRAAFLVFVTFVPLYVATTRGHFLSTDEVTVYQAARSIWENGNVSVQIHDTREVLRGRGGAFYPVYNSGEAIAVVPFYAAGQMIDALLPADSFWRRALAGHPMSRPGVVWSGEVPIFFVNLFNAFMTAALMAVFFVLALQMTQDRRWALLTTLLLGSTTYIASLSSSLFQQTSEALFSLSAFSLFFLDRRTPDWRLRAWAGGLLALMIQFRYPAVLALPGLLTYHAASIWIRRDERSPGLRIRAAAAELFPSLCAVAAGFVLHWVDQYLKFGSIRSVGYLPFDTPLAVGAYGYLFSPGMSIFLYTPLLVLVPFAVRTFHKRYALESGFLLLHASVYLIVYGSYRDWHGLWYFGPRYLAPLIPFLCLPIAVWISEKGRRVLVPVLSLGVLGLWMQVIHVAVNFWMVAVTEGYVNSGPRREFLFIPYNAPFIAHSRALLAGDQRVDMWLVDVARFVSTRMALGLSLLLAAAVILGLMALMKTIEREQQEPLPRSLRYAAPAVPLLILASAFIFPSAVSTRNVRTPEVVRAGPAASNEQLMLLGVDALYKAHDPAAAEALFRTVLSREPTHYGANYQLAVALDQTGRAKEAEFLWEKVLKMAETYRDQPTIDIARERLRRR